MKFMSGLFIDGFLLVCYVANRLRVPNGVHSSHGPRSANGRPLVSSERRNCLSPLLCKA